MYLLSTIIWITINCQTRQMFTLQSLLFVIPVGLLWNHIPRADCYAVWQRWKPRQQPLLRFRIAIFSCFLLVCKLWFMTTLCRLKQKIKSIWYIYFFLRSGDITKFGRGESASPAPSASLSAAHGPQTAQPPQAQGQGQNQPQPQGHHNTQQTFLNPALPPGYSYTGLPYYPGVPGVPSAFQYGPTMFVPPSSAKQHGMGLSNPTTPFQQPSGYGQHAFSSGLCRLDACTHSHAYSVLLSVQVLFLSISRVWWPDARPSRNRVQQRLQ